MDNTLKGIIAGTIAALIWGAFPVVTRLGIDALGNLNEHDITALRFSIAGLIMMPYLIKYGLKNISPIAIILIVCGAGVPYVLVVSIGLTYAPASHFGMIAPSTMLIVSTLASWVFLGDKPNTLRALGVLIIVVGVCLIGSRKILMDTGTDSVVLGHLCFLAGGTLWAIYTVASKYWGINPFHSTAIVSVVSMMCYLPYYLLAIGPDRIIANPLESLVQGVVQGVFTAFLALLFFSKAVDILGASKGAIFAALVPGTAMLLSIPILAEKPTVLELTGVGVVTLGMFFAMGLASFFIRTILQPKQHKKINNHSNA